MITDFPATGRKIRQFSITFGPILLLASVFSPIRESAAGLYVLLASILGYGWGTWWAQDSNTRTGELPLPRFLAPTPQTRLWAKQMQRIMGWLSVLLFACTSAHPDSVLFWLGQLCIVTMILWFALEFARWKPNPIMSED